MTINLNNNIFFQNAAYLHSIQLPPSLRFSVFLSFATYSFVSCCLTLGVRFYVLGGSAISSGLEIAALSKRCPIAPSSTVLPQCQSQVLHDFPICGVHVPSYCGWAVISLGTASMQDWPPLIQLKGLATSVAYTLLYVTDSWCEHPFKETPVLVKGICQVWLYCQSSVPAWTGGPRSYFGQCLLPIEGGY